jgi:lysophospholipase L1-like esterase
LKRKWVLASFVAILLCAAAAVVWFGRELKAERRAAWEFRLQTKTHLEDLRAEIRNSKSALSSELTTQKEQIAAMIFDRVPPLYGGHHVALRTRFILEQVRQSTGGSTLLLGDSITEGLFLDGPVGMRVINGGIGGAGVRDLTALVQQVAPRSMHLVVIAIGVNDTMLARSHGTSEWEQIFRQLISRAKGVARNEVVVSTILPVEGGKPLGSAFFDEEKIHEINQVIRRVAGEQGLTLIDGFAAFAPLVGKTEFTTDGVHLNALGYTKLRSILSERLR